MSNYKKLMLLTIVAIVLAIAAIGISIATINTTHAESEEPVTADATDKTNITVEADENGYLPDELFDEDEVEPLVYFDCPLDNDLQDYIRVECEKYELPMQLVIAMIECESSFHADSISKGGDYGLMQINKCNHKWLSKKFGVTDFLDPYQNVKCGIYLIGTYFNKYEGEIHKALMCYNMGEGGAKKVWKQGKLTSSYSRKVMSKVEKYEKNPMLQL